MRPTKQGFQRALFRLTGSRLFWAVAITMAFLLPIARSVGRQLPPLPPVYAELPPFQLVDEQGQPFTRDSLRGKVWVADFIFTSCAEVCPKLTARMSELQYHLRNMGNAVHLVSFSVDPEHDTPAVLRAYGERYHARPQLWTFLTGPLEAIQSTVVSGFKIAMQRTADPDTGFFQIVHGEHFVLVDQEGRIRGYFPTTDDGIQELLNGLSLLANLGPRQRQATAAATPPARTPRG